MKNRNNPTANSYPTIKAAREAGFQEKRPDQYGGEVINMKGRILVRNPCYAESESEWEKRGLRVKKGSEPHAKMSYFHAGCRKRIFYDVYREDQVEPKRKQVSLPPRQIPLAAALWAINRRAKRCRNLARDYHAKSFFGWATYASREKEELYQLKSQALQHLINDGLATHVVCHRFPDGNWAELFHFEGYSFHRPCPPKNNVAVAELNEIEAKPKAAQEPRLKDALYTIKGYLKDRPMLRVFEWPM